MGRTAMWTMAPSEKLTLAKSLASDLETGETLSGTPVVTIYKAAGSGWSDKTSDFTVANEQVNASALTTERGETIAISEGVAFTLTAPATEGEYAVELSCGATDGTTPKSMVRLVVTRQP